jgi:pSer/pThr/pTyr-binding forkhead associated (FHA) protein
MPSPPPPVPIGTVYETDEEILQALRASGPAPASGPAVPMKPKPPVPGRPVPPSPAVPVPATAPAAAKAAPDSTAVSMYRPTSRPPVAHLIVCDDGRTEGEIIHLRADRFVIGRTEGDFLIPHDSLISGRHVEITRQPTGNRYRWVVTDLNSMNGMFVRVSRAALSDRSEFLVGAGRYRLETPETMTIDHIPTGEGTLGWDAEPAPIAQPALVELVAGGIGNRYVLSRPEYWIGADPNCSISRPDDSFCEPWHARIYRDPGTGWHAEHKKSLNGLWLRVPQITSEKGCQFQIGEQRFRLVAEV